MIITTTPTIEGHPIQEYLGLVTGEVIVGASSVKSSVVCPIRISSPSARTRSFTSRRPLTCVPLALLRSLR